MSLHCSKCEFKIFVCYIQGDSCILEGGTPDLLLIEILRSTVDPSVDLIDPIRRRVSGNHSHAQSRISKSRLQVIL